MGNAVARTTIAAKLIRNVGNGALAGSIGGAHRSHTMGAAT